jgi:hypothetical protein
MDSGHEVEKAQEDWRVIRHFAIVLPTVDLTSPLIIPLPQFTSEFI